MGAGVQMLPTSYSAATASKFDLFITTFGTHVMLGAQFGGVWGQVSKFSRSAWNNMVSNGLDVQASASYSGLMSAGASISSQSARTDAQSFMSADPTTLAAKRQSLKTALASYCSTLVAGGYISSCGAPGPDPTPVPAAREWMPWSYNYRPYGKYYSQECPTTYD